MATELKEFLSSHKPKGFAAIPHYFASGDYVSFYHRDERCYAQRVDEFLTIYRSMDGGEVVGCEITQVRTILKAAKSFIETAESFGVHLNGGEVTLGFLFLVGLTLAKDETQKQHYFELREMVKNVPINELRLV